MQKIQLFMFKYGYYIHTFFGFFWLWILFGSIKTTGFTVALLLPLLFLVMTVFNIYKLYLAKNPKS